MSVNIYEEYVVEIFDKGSYISEEDSTPGDIVFSKYSEARSFIWNGGKLIDYIAKLCSDNYIQSIAVIEDTTPYPLMDSTDIEFEFFNPSNGEGQDITIRFRLNG